MIAADLLPSLWAEAIRTAVLNINYLPTALLRKVAMILYEALTGKKLNIAYLRPFGTTVYAHDYKYKQKGKMVK